MRQIAAAAAVFVLLLSGCASIPDSGPVTEVAGERAEPQAPARIRPGSPGEDSTPTQITNGFLEAMKAAPVRYDIAREFLTPEAADAWQPRSGTAVYSDAELDPSGTSDSPVVDMRYVADAVLDQRGRYHDGTDEDAAMSFVMENVDDQWRISNPPSGLMISQQFFISYYLPLDAYYFDRTGSQMVADPLYLPFGDQLTTAAMSSLLSGPAGLLDDQARTYIPEGMSLDSVTVPVRDDGVAEVTLRGDASLTAGQSERLSAQVVRTIAQVPSVTGIRLSIGGTTLSYEGDTASPTSDIWAAFDIQDLAARTRLLALRGGRIVILDDSEVGPIAGTGAKVPDAVDFRVDPTLSSVATVPSGRGSVDRGPFDGSAARRTVYEGRDVLKPVWDDLQRLWVVDRRANGSRLTVVGPKERTTVPMGILGGLTITSFGLSADNARFVAIAHNRSASGPAGRLYVGTVRYTEDGKGVAGLTEIEQRDLSSAGLSLPVSATWETPTSVAVLASLEGAALQAYSVVIDGSAISGASLSNEGLLADVGASEVVGSGVATAPVYVTDEDGRLWVENTEGRWVQVTSEALWSPSYPG